MEGRGRAPVPLNQRGTPRPPQTAAALGWFEVQDTLAVTSSPRASRSLNSCGTGTCQTTMPCFRDTAAHHVLQIRSRNQHPSPCATQVEVCSLSKGTASDRMQAQKVRREQATHLALGGECDNFCRSIILTCVTRAESGCWIARELCACTHVACYANRVPRSEC